MGEIEVPMEQIHENIHHAVHEHGQSSGGRLLERAAILSAVLAVLAAISALFAGGYANEAMIEQIQASDQWALYQAKGIKLAIVEAKPAVAGEDSRAQTDRYRAEQAEIKVRAEEKEHESHYHFHKHETLAASVTFFQVAIAMVAIAILARKKSFLFGSMGLGLLGLAWMVRAFLILS